MNQKYTTIIFDMDGTIIETEHLWREATRTILHRRGVRISDELDNYLAAHFSGLSLPATCAIIKKLTESSEPLEDLMAEKSAIACSLYEQGIRFIPGFENFHQKVVNAQLKSGLATNADDNTLAITKHTLKLDRFFGEHLYNISHVNFVGKPDPSIYLYAANKLQSKPELCVAIEDSTHGVTAAKRAGMFCIGINTSGHKDRLKHADLIIDSYDEIELDKLLK